MNPMESKCKTNIPTINCEGSDASSNVGDKSSGPDTNNTGFMDKDNTDAVISGDIGDWQVDDVVQWAAKVVQFTPAVVKCLQLEAIDGQVLLTLTEEDIRDFRYRLNYNLRFGELKKLWQSIYHIQQQNRLHNRLSGHQSHNLTTNHQYHHSKQPASNKNNLNIRITDGSPLHHNHNHQRPNHTLAAAATAVTFTCSCGSRNCGTYIDNCTFNDCESCAHEMSSVSEGCSANIPPEFFKTSISLGKFINCYACTLSQTLF